MRRQWVSRMMVVAAVCMAAPVWSQDPAQIAQLTPSVRAALQTEVMVRKLSLSPEQRTQVEAINLKYANQMQPLLEGSKWTLMRQAKTVDEAKDGELRAVLNPQQFDGYLAAKDEIRDKMKQKALANAAANPS